MSALKEKLELERIIFGVALPGAVDLAPVLTNPQKYQGSFFPDYKTNPPTVFQLISMRKEGGSIFLYSKLGDTAIRWSPSLGLYIPTKMSLCEGRPLGSVEIPLGQTQTYEQICQKLCLFLTNLNSEPASKNIDADGRCLRDFVNQILEFDLNDPLHSNVSIFISENTASESNFLRSNASFRSKSTKWKEDHGTDIPISPFATKLVDHLHDAVQQGDIAGLEKLLLDNTLIPTANRRELIANAIDSHGWTPLQHAALKNDEPVCSKLLDFGSDPKIAGYEGLSPIHYLTKANSHAFLALQSVSKPDRLTERKPSVDNKKKMIGDFMTSFVNDSLGNFGLRGMITSSEWNFSGFDENQSSILNYLKTMRLLSAFIALGSSIDQRNSQGETALHYACKGKCFYIAKFLILNGANINATTKVNFTPLHFAMFSTEELALENGELLSQLHNEEQKKKGKGTGSKGKVIKIKDNQMKDSFEGTDIDSYTLMIVLLSFMLERGANTKLRATADPIAIRSSKSFSDNDDVKITLDSSIDDNSVNSLTESTISTSSSEYIDESIDESFQEWVSRQPEWLQKPLQKALHSNMSAAGKQRRSMMIKHSIMKSLQKELYNMSVGDRKSQLPSGSEDKLDKRKKEDPVLKEPKQVLTELVDKEASYFNFLDSLKTNFMNDTVENMIGKENHSLVFKHFTAIYNLHKQLVEVLPTSSLLGATDYRDGRNSVLGETEMISDEEFRTLLPIVISSFNTFLPHFKIYGDYVNNMGRAMSIITKQKQSSEKFAIYCREMTSKNEGRLDVADLLIMPFQKITRYSLLFERLAKLTPESITSSLQFPQSSQSSRALTDNLNPMMAFCNEFTRLVASINQSKIESEARQKVIDVASLLSILSVATTANSLLKDHYTENLSQFGIEKTPSIPVSDQFVEPHRTFIREGKITRFSDEGPIDTVCYLFNDVVVFHLQNAKQRRYPHDAYVFDLSNLVILDLPDSEETVYDSKGGLPVVTITNCFQLVAMRSPSSASVRNSSVGYYSRIMENWTLALSSQAEKKEWTNAIRRAKRDLDLKLKSFSPIK